MFWGGMALTSPQNQRAVGAVLTARACQYYRSYATLRNIYKATNESLLATLEQRKKVVLGC